MAREEFIDNLRLASRILFPPKVSSRQGARADAQLSSALYSADVWLIPKTVEGFDRADWPEDEREKLEEEVAGFLAIAKEIQPTKSATKSQSIQARKHLEGAIKIVGSQLKYEWLEAQQKMMKEAMTAAQSKGWYTEEDEKELLESLLGTYKAPRLRIRTPKREVVLDPIARFGSGRQGVVDLVVMPTYETVYLVVFKDDRWQIIAPHGPAHSRPFTQTTLVNTITRLPQS